MKRSEMAGLIRAFLETRIEKPLAVGIEDDLLEVIEAAGMKPPRLSEAKVQAIMHIFAAGYSFYEWDEKFEKNEKLMARYREYPDYPRKPKKSKQSQPETLKQKSCHTR